MVRKNKKHPAEDVADTFAIADWPEEKGADQSALDWLREALVRRFAATKSAPPSDDDWKECDWST